MRYDHVTTGTFIERPNRFIAMVEIDGIITKCHVKNTGYVTTIHSRSIKIIALVQTICSNVG